MFRYLLDSEIEEIFAAGSDGVRDDECATVSARMSNGVLLTAEFSERAPHEIELVVSGRDAMLRVDCLRFDGLEQLGKRDVPGAPGVRLRNVGRFLRELPGGLRLMRRGGDYRDSYRRAWRHFAQAVHSGSRPEATLEDGLRAVEAVCGAVRSRLTGMRVALPATSTLATPSRADVAVSSSAGRARAENSGHLAFSVVIPTCKKDI